LISFQKELYCIVKKGAIMIKDNLLYNDHKDMFKKRYGLAYYLKTFFSYPTTESFMFISLAGVIFTLISGLFFKTQQFLLGSLTIGIYMTMLSCYVYQLYYLKTYYKNIPLDKRKDIIRSVIKYTEEIKAQYDMEDEITRNVLDRFAESQKLYFGLLLSDDDDNVKSGIQHFFNDGDEYMFNFENDIKNLDESIDKEKQQKIKHIAELNDQQRVKHRLSEILEHKETEAITN